MWCSLSILGRGFSGRVLPVLKLTDGKTTAEN
jgi:hypothetical protein